MKLFAKGADKIGARTVPDMMRRLARICMDAAFPGRCRNCEVLCSGQVKPGIAPDAGVGQKVLLFRTLMADYLCMDCLAQYAPVQSPLCVTCGRPFRSRHGVDHVCPHCREHAYGFDSARAAGFYNEILKTLIRLYKYQGRTELALPLGALLWDAWHGFYDAASFDGIIPVPLHWFRQYRRGFNQAALMVRQWVKLAAEQHARFDPGIIMERALLRCRHTASQTGLDKGRRSANVKGAFLVRDGNAIRGMRILLVDDVMTTGATADACAKALKQAGAASVQVLTLARAV